MRILVTDPDPDVRRLVSFAVALKGHSPEQAVTARDALTRAGHAPTLDVILLDACPPAAVGDNGDLAALARHPGPPVLLMARAVGDVRAELLASGGRAVKLATVDNLRAAVRLAGLNLLG